MILDKAYLQEFKDRLIAEEKVDFEANLAIYEAMWQEAVELGVLPSKDPCDGLENAVRISSILNRIPEHKNLRELLEG